MQNIEYKGYKLIDTSRGYFIELPEAPQVGNAMLFRTLEEAKHYIDIMTNVTSKYSTPAKDEDDVINRLMDYLQDCE